MAAIFIFLVIVTAILFSLLRWQKSTIFMLFVLLVSYVVVANGILSAVLLTRLQAPFVTKSSIDWKDKNAIVVLGNGAVKLPAENGVRPTALAYSRIVQAAQLYFECVKSGKKCHIIISGGDTVHTGVSEAISYKELLQTLNVPPADIRAEAQSLNTFQNAKFTGALLKQTSYDEVILVTSGYHLQRSLLYFSYFGITAKPVSADYFQSDITIIPNSFNFVLTDLALHEYVGIMRFYVYNFLGWNKKS